jgi:RNA polymerase sigma-70 factor (ECF subfamily)
MMQAAAFYSISQSILGINRLMLHLFEEEATSTVTIIDKLCLARALKHRIAERRGRLYGVAYAWCGDRHLADDLAQEAITRAINKCHQLREASRLDSWLYSVLNNCWREHLRMQPVQIEVEDHNLECTHCPERLNLSGELAKRLMELMHYLPENQRQVLALVVLEDFSYQEVAETLDIPIGTVMSRLSRARRFLAEQLHAASEPVIRPHFHLRRVK